MSQVQEFKNYLQPGRFYRRAELASRTKSLPKVMLQLLADGILIRMASGLFYCPKKLTSGTNVIDDKKLVKAFLNGRRFLMVLPSDFGELGIDAPPLSNRITVYTHKRFADINLGGRLFHFRKRHRFPLSLSPEFVLVDIASNIDIILGNKKALLKLICKKARKLNPLILAQAAHTYGDSWANKFFAIMAANSKALNTDPFFQKIPTRIRSGRLPKLTPEQIEDALRRRYNGETVTDIARSCNVPIGMISKYTTRHKRSRQTVFTPQSGCLISLKREKT